MGQAVSDEMKELGYELYQTASLARVLREMIQENAQGIQWGEDATNIAEMLANRLDEHCSTANLLAEGKTIETFGN